MEPEARLTPERFFSQLRHSPRAVLLLDYDGTLAPFHRDPAKAVPYPGLPALLGEIMRAGTRVVLISGRRAQDLVALLGVFPPPEIWGSYGLQRLRPDGRHALLLPVGAVAQTIREAAAWLENAGMGELAESKPGGIAVHWRGLEPEEAARVESRVREGWYPLVQRTGVSLLEFDGGLELRMSARDKGHVVRLILEETGSHVPVAYLGDDRSDEAAFRALKGVGLPVQVGTTARETAAALRLRPPAELAHFLGQWLQARRHAQVRLSSEAERVGR